MRSSALHVKASKQLLHPVSEPHEFLFALNFVRRKRGSQALDFTLRRSSIPGLDFVGCYCFAIVVLFTGCFDLQSWVKNGARRAI